MIASYDIIEKEGTLPYFLYEGTREAWRYLVPGWLHHRDLTQMFTGVISLSLKKSDSNVERDTIRGTVSDPMFYSSQRALTLNLWKNTTNHVSGAGDMSGISYSSHEPVVIESVKYNKRDNALIIYLIRT